MELGRATLIWYKPGFGGDNYRYRLDPPYQGTPIIRLGVGWGLGAAMHTGVYAAGEDTVGHVILAEWTGEDVSAEEALRRLGYDADKALRGRPGLDQPLALQEFRVTIE